MPRKILVELTLTQAECLGQIAHQAADSADTPQMEGVFRRAGEAIDDALAARRARRPDPRCKDCGVRESVHWSGSGRFRRGDSACFCY